MVGVFSVRKCCPFFFFFFFNLFFVVFKLTHFYSGFNFLVLAGGWGFIDYWKLESFGYLVCLRVVLLSIFLDEGHAPAL